MYQAVLRGLCLSSLGRSGCSQQQWGGGTFQWNDPLCVASPGLLEGFMKPLGGGYHLSLLTSEKTPCFCNPGPSSIDALQLLDSLLLSPVTTTHLRLNPLLKIPEANLALTGSVSKGQLSSFRCSRACLCEAAPLRILYICS